MRGQTAVEYILFVGAAVLIALLAVVFISPQFTQSGGKLSNSISVLKNYSIASNGSTASAQTTATIQANQPFSTVSGFVKDDSGNPIEGAAVKLFLATQQLDSSITGYSGFYSIKATSNGNYVLNASKNGFATQQASLTVSIGNDYSQDFALSRN